MPAARRRQLRCRCSWRLRRPTLRPRLQRRRLRRQRHAGWCSFGRTSHPGSSPCCTRAFTRWVMRARPSWQGWREQWRAQHATRAAFLPLSQSPSACAHNSHPGMPAAAWARGTLATGLAPSPCRRAEAQAAPEGGPAVHVGLARHRLLAGGAPSQLLARPAAPRALPRCALLFFPLPHLPFAAMPCCVEPVLLPCSLLESVAASYCCPCA